MKLPLDIIELLELHIDEAGLINEVSPAELAVAVIKGAAEEGNLAEDYS